MLRNNILIMVKRKSLEEWLKKVNNISRNKYIFLNTIYENNRSYFIMKCKNNHNEFKKYTNDLIKKQSTECCKTCRELKQYNLIIEKCKNIYNNYYIYEGYKIEKKRMFIKVKCNHIEKYMMTKNHCYKRKECNTCKVDREQIKRARKFIEQSTEIHNNFYKYDKVNKIKKLKDQVEIYCPVHDIYFEQIAKNHMDGQGCVVCANIKYSKMQIKWLKIKNIVDNTYIEHILNKGEYKIKEIGKRGINVDGYSKELNKVYEFNGDYWHGNPKKYNEHNINPTNKKTYGELYDNTKMRISKIKDLGYIVEEMWEYDWILRIKLLKEINNLKK